jgi:hypothetical protein
MNSSPPVPPFHGQNSFNAQHSPCGAFFSFTCGNFGTRGGFGLQIGKPGNQNIYVGARLGERNAKSPIRCLPFFQGAQGANAASAFLVEQASTPASGASPVEVYATDQIKRHYGWGSDRWVTPDFEFILYTPIVDLPDPETATAGHMQRALLPAVVGELIVDNSRGQSPKTAFFGLDINEPGIRVSPGALGFEHRDGFGMRAAKENGAFAFQRWTVQQGLEDANPVHMLGRLPGVGITVPPGEKRTLRIALGVHLPANVMLGMEGQYLYTRYYGCIDQVLDAALERFDELKAAAIACDQRLLGSGLSADQQFLIAHSTRSYYGSTQLLLVGGKPFWIVNEGEYCMLNTLDLSVDHVFWELDRNPWVVRNLLDNFVRFFSYQDQVRARGSRQWQLGGLSFCHDMGAYNVFSPVGNSSYELPNLDALCFSYMTAEQLCNWIIIGATYVLKTNDLSWASSARATIEACLQSLINRGDENGFLALDSSRCGPDGAEITTYDSLDHSLAQTRNNLYMVVKAWASYAGLALLLEKLGAPAEAARAAKMMDAIAAALPGKAGKDGIFPAVFEADNSGYTSRILPAIEALVYLLKWGCITEPVPHANAAVNAKMIASLRKHTLELLADDEARNFFPDGGLRLSSTSNNSWMSKIALFQQVVKKVWSLHQTPELGKKLDRADAAHVKWQTQGDSAYWAMSDQMVNGVAIGSKYYPRCITTALWME